MEDTTSYGLLSRMRKGDGIAWDDFHRRYCHLLALYARAAGLGGQEMEELVNDVLFELFNHDKRSLFRYDRTKGRFRDYLRAIANRVAVNILRRRITTRAPLPECAGETGSVLAEIERAEQEERERIILAEAISEMKLRCSPRHLHIFMEYVVRGRPVAEVARESGLGAGNIYTVKSRLQKEFGEICRELEEII